MDSIRTSDVESQRSIENMTEITIYPAVEFPQGGREGSIVPGLFSDRKIPFFFWMNRCVLWSADRILKKNLWKRRKNVWRSGYELEEEEAKIFPVADILKEDQYCYSSIGFFALEMKCRGLEVRESYEIQAEECESVQ